MRYRVFYWFNHFKTQKVMNTSSQNTLRYLAWLIVILVGIFVVSQQVYKRFDLTQDKRYTLSEVSKIRCAYFS